MVKIVQKTGHRIKRTIREFAEYVTMEKAYLATQIKINQILTAAVKYRPIIPGHKAKNLCPQKYLLQLHRKLSITRKYF